MEMINNAIEYYNSQDRNESKIIKSADIHPEIQDGLTFQTKT